MTQPGQTDNFSIRDFERILAKYLGGNIERIIYNNRQPDSSLIHRYAREGELYVVPEKNLPPHRYIGANLISRKFPDSRRGDPLKRTLIRHDPYKLAKLLMQNLP